MKNYLINQVLFRMQGLLTEEQLNELQTSMYIVLCDYDIEAKTQEVMEINTDWQTDLNEFLMAKSLEGKSPHTIKQYKYELTLLLSYLNKGTDSITTENVFTFMQHYKNYRNICNQTLENKRLVYSSFFTWMHGKSKIAQNPMCGIGKIKVEEKLKKPFSDEERETLFCHCKNVRDKAIMEFFYSSGVRVSELVALNRDEVSFISKELVVLGKGAKERIVYINAKAKLYLQEYLGSRSDSNPALFVSLKQPFRRLTKTGIEDMIRRTGRRANVEKAHPHRFRRTMATNAINRGMPLQEVSKLMGHKKIETTMLYCNVDQKGVKLSHSKYLSA